MIMKTIETKLTAANNAEYKNNSTNNYVENYKKQTLEILQNPNTTFSEFIDEQSIATDISRLWWLKSGAMLKEQLSSLWLFQKGQNVEKEEAVNNLNFMWAPNKTVVLWWLAA